ncbi:hypothetical protein HPB48_021211 [Haemaphysalis longicornis]|uniref:Hexosyltransferase n=1 Tax=Haemaphysalis longicornis TaxID=44386 RepID=A0A9J6FX06_HAELO|nr:hypothetical protein HPB48_021211 [Haemaphysalis longicornis]
MRRTLFILATTVGVLAISRLGNFTALKYLLADEEFKHMEYWSHEVFQGALREREQYERTRLPHRGGWAVEARCREAIDVLFFVHACSRQWGRRVALRDSLVEEAAMKRFNWTAVFFVGRTANDPLLDAWLNLEADALGDLVVFPIKDSYWTVTPKWLAGMHWVVDHCPNVPVVVKLDDDVAVHPFKVKASDCRGCGGNRKLIRRKELSYWGSSLCPAKRFQDWHSVLLIIITYYFNCC